MILARGFKRKGLVLYLLMLAVHLLVHIVASELSRPSTVGKQQNVMGELISHRDLLHADAVSSTGMHCTRFASQCQ